VSLEEDVREQLREALRLHVPVPDRVWIHLVDLGLVAKVLGGEIGIAALVPEFWVALKVSGLWNKVFQDPPMLTAQQRDRAADHQAVLAILLAREATAEPAVAEFRRRVLDGRLLTVLEAVDWLSNQASTDGEPTVWIDEVIVPSGYVVRRVPQKWTVFTEPGLIISPEHPGQASSRMVVCALAGQPLVALQTRAGSVLEDLRMLGERLARQFAWSPMQATSFVLTGETPALPLIRTKNEYSRRRPGCTRIILEIDPTAPPRLVAERYRQVRRGLFSHQVKALTTKHLKLAAFAALQPAEASWGSQLQVWNRRHPKWKYNRLKNFKRDCLQAQRRLLTLGEQVRRRPSSAPIASASK